MVSSRCALPCGSATGLGAGGWWFCAGAVAVCRSGVAIPRNNGIGQDFPQAGKLGGRRV